MGGCCVMDEASARLTECRVQCSATFLIGREEEVSSLQNIECADLSRSDSSTTCLCITVFAI